MNRRNRLDMRVMEEFDVSQGEVDRRCVTLSVGRVVVALLLLTSRFLWPGLWSCTGIAEGESLRLTWLVLWAYTAAVIFLLGLTLTTHHKKRFTMLGLGADLLVAAVVVAMTGGIHSQFVLLFMLTIVGSAVMLSPLTGVVVAVGSISLISLVYLGETSGWWPQCGRPGSSSETVFKFVAVMSFLMLTAFLSGYLALKSSRMKLLNVELLENFNAGMIIADLDGKVQYLNSMGGEMLGIVPGSARGKAVERVMVMRGINVLRETLDTGDPISRRETGIITHLGKTMPSGITTSVLSDRRRKMWGVLATFIDLTEVKKIDEKLRHADRMATIAQLAAGMGHEIRNPLACIMGAIELLNDILSDEKDIQDVTEIIFRETERLSAIVENFLDISRISSPRCTRFSFAALWEEVESVLHARLGEVAQGNVRIAATWEPADLQLNADLGQMRQALLNLVQNGIEALPGEGAVMVSSKKASRAEETGAESGVQIIVRDSGPGVPEDREDRIFDPFYTSKARGTGLGLAVVRRIVEGHGGDVSLIESRKGGAAFRIWVPGTADDSQ